jgi:FkbM family methyltransferase
MKPYEQTSLNKLGKLMAGSLSQLVANPATTELSTLFEAYWCFLLGKGSGTRTINVEAYAARSFINCSSPVLFDVGANLGEWASRLHSMFPASQIFLFEPQPDCQKILQDKKIPNSKLISKAVSSTCGVTKIYTPDSTSGIASLHQRLDTPFKNKGFATYDVETVTLDSIIEAYHLNRVDFMKMDIEGHELSALQGASKSLEAGVIKAFSFEFGSGNINSRTFFRDFWDLLSPMNYQIYRILPSSRLMRIKDYYEDCEYFRGVSNYIAVLNQK